MAASEAGQLDLQIKNIYGITQIYVIDSTIGRSAVWKSLFSKDVKD